MPAPLWESVLLVLVGMDSLFFRILAVSGFFEVRVLACMWDCNCLWLESLPVVLAMHGVFGKAPLHGGFCWFSNTVGTLAVFHEFAQPLFCHIPYRQVNTKCCGKVWWIMCRRFNFKVLNHIGIILLWWQNIVKYIGTSFSLDCCVGIAGDL